MTISGNVVIGSVLLAVFAVGIALSTQYPVEARLMPIGVCLAGAVLCLIQLWQGVAADRRANRPRGAADGALLRREIGLLAWFVIFLLGIALFGFLIAAPLLVFGFLWINQRERALFSVGLAAGCLAALYLVFERMLELYLFRGLATAFLFG